MISDRLSQIRSRMTAAAGTAGRDHSSIRLVAVSKTFPVEAVREAYAAGQREFGENRVQEGLQKIGETTDLTIRWHLLGHLQTNKARRAGPAFAMVQSVDSVELMQKLDDAAAEAGRTPELLIQVDLAGEATKFGASPSEVPRLFEAASACRAATVARAAASSARPPRRRGTRPRLRRAAAPPLALPRTSWLHRRGPPESGSPAPAPPPRPPGRASPAARDHRPTESSRTWAPPCAPCSSAGGREDAT